MTLFSPLFIRLSYLLLIVFAAHQTGAQTKNKRWELSAGISLPQSEFVETHFAGPCIQVSYADHRFGKLYTLPKKKLGYVLNAGISHFFGNIEGLSGYDITYADYFILHAYGGGIFNTGNKFNLSLAAGPALSHYEKNWRFNIGSNLSGTYYFNRKWGASTALQFLNETGARPLWSVSIKACYAF